MAAKTFQKSVLTIFAVLFLLALSTFAALPRYKIINLGTLGGTYSCAYAVNDAGQVVGISGSRAFLWDSSTGMIDLGVLALPIGGYSVAYGINDASQVVGYSGSDEGHAFYWDLQSGMIDLGAILGSGDSEARCINNNGQVVGIVYVHPSCAFLWDPDNGVINLGTLGGTYSSARAINNIGQVVGGSNSGQGLHAFLWDSINGMRDLGTLGSGESIALGISNHGQVVGRSQYEPGNDNYRAFLWDNNNGMIDLHESFVFGTEGSAASAISDAGQIVGHLNPWGLCVAFYLDNDNGMVKLENLIPPGSMWKELKFAFDINNRGQIVGQGITDGGKTLAFLMTPVPPKIIYVDADAVGANDGSSWADAYNRLQDALAAAYFGDKIWVAQGVYKPDAGGGNTSGDRKVTFQLIDGVTIMGGYAGFGEPDPNARDVDVYKTILSGDLAGDDGPDFANNSENSRNVVTGNGTITAILDGFIIMGGNANGPSCYSGGGLYNQSGRATILNCTFIGNWARDSGGGMYNKHSTPTLIDCTFTCNMARVGGGMYNEYSTPTLINCTFSDNIALAEEGSYGGGMYNYYSNPILTNCIFTRNMADVEIPDHGGGEGGGMFNADSDPTLTNCTFTGNKALCGGGGMANGYSSSPTP